MLRSFLIVTFSLSVAGIGFGQSATWSRGSATLPYLQFNAGDFTGYAEIRVAFVPVEGVPYYFVKGPNGGFFEFQQGVNAGAYANSAANFNAFQNQFAYGSSGSAEFRLSIDGSFTDWRTEMPSEETTKYYDWELGEEWGGAVVEVRDAEGNTVLTHIIPEGGGSIQGNVTGSFEFLSGLQVYIDGVAVATMFGSDFPNEEEWIDNADRPGFAFSFDGSYQGGEWEARRPDGSVAARGDAASVGVVLQGRLTIGAGESAEIYTRVPAGGDNGSAWVPTGVTVTGSQTTYYSFVNNPEVADPIPMPTPGPVSSPMPAPLAPTNVTVNPGSVTNPTNTDENVTVDVGSVEVPNTDDGEEEVINAIGDIRQLMQGIVADMGQVQANLVAASEEFNGLRLGGVGRNCSFQMGPASINLQTSGPIRTGLTLLVIGIAGFAAASMLRNAVQ